MRKLQGIAVSPGVAIGEAFVMDSEGFRIPRRFVTREAVDSELDRLDRAIVASGNEIALNRDRVAAELGGQYAAIFSAHLQMLNDPRLRAELEEQIRKQHFCPEHAVSRTLRQYVKVFQSLDGGFASPRAHDILDIEKRLLRHLLGQQREELSHLTSPVLVLAYDLTPSETANLNREFVKGFVTEIGGPGSHTAIVAQGLEIPAVVGAGPFLTDVSGGDFVIIDGDQGTVILQPDEETLLYYRRQVEAHRSVAAQLDLLRDVPAETGDHHRIELMGNIEFPSEASHCMERGSDGIGLYRTEFLYLGSEAEPDEDTHYAAYAQVTREMQGRPVVIRTLDLGADKLSQSPRPEEERNPVLGLRSIRLSLRNLPMFRVQLRAILRASVLGDVRIMFPMITTVLEFRQAKMVLADVMEDLDENGIPFRRNTAVGMMVEVPAAVMMIDHFVREADFVSIGTNDLIQYTLAVDRDNRDVASLYTGTDPAVLRLIHRTVSACLDAGIPAGLCGQMSGNPLFTMFLLGVGLRQLSVTPGAIPEIKRICRGVTIPECEKVATKALQLENARDIHNFLRRELNACTQSEEY
jgi:phosphotransferase system enzyme I (PtsI)